MNEDDKDELKEARADWLEHPYTAQWAEGAAKTEEKSRKELNACCDVSTDPNVRGAFRAWKEKAVFLAWLRTGK